jgi:hypothetical protein
MLVLMLALVLVLGLVLRAADPSLPRLLQRPRPEALPVVRRHGGPERRAVRGIDGL